MTPLDSLERVELGSAWMWDCPECGIENFQRAITTFLDSSDEDDAEAIAALYGETPPDGVLAKCVSHPNRVVCKHCKREFRPFHENPTEGDE